MPVTDAPPAGWVRGVDGSYAELTPAIVDELRAAGVEVWWQCLWTGRERPPFAIDNLEAARAGGMVIAGYGSLTPAAAGWWHAEETRWNVPDDLWDALRVVPCDVELDGISDEAIRNFVDRLNTYGKRRAIYTSYDAWTNKQGDSRAFSDCLLCNAYWDGDPDVDFAALPFGGWTADQVLLEQYTGGTIVNGIEVDRDVWNRALLFGEESEAPMDAPTKGEFGQLYAWVKRQSDVITALAEAVGDMARHVYTEDEPMIEALNVRLADLRKLSAAAAAAVPPADTS